MGDVLPSGLTQSTIFERVSTDQSRSSPMSNRRKTLLYYAAAVCVLLVAAALRFYDLPGRGVGGDEAIAANNSRVETLGEVLENTRNRNSSPILYPLVLYAVQKVESSSLSVRIVPAVASVLTIGVFLFLLPRVGVSRWAAFIAALLSAGSFEAIWHARAAREYSIDALLAVSMIVGLLSYVHGKGRPAGGWYVLLCASLFAAPLLQYGLVLFCIAVLGTIAVMEGKTLWFRRDSLQRGLHFSDGWVWNRLLYPVGAAASFAVGCAISYATTFRHHWDLGTFTGPGHWGGFAPGYYLGEYSDVPALIWFVLSRTEALFRFHLTTDVLTILGLGGVGVFLIVSLRKARLDAITTLFLLSLAVAAVAALILAYPYGGMRQCMYLAPIVLLASGHALHSIAVGLSWFTRRARLAHLAMASIAGVIALSGTAAVTGSGMYRSLWEHTSFEPLVLALEEREHEGDVVYVTTQAVPSVGFYHKEWRNNYCYGSSNSRDWRRGPRDWTRDPIEVCVDYLFGKFPEAERMWLMIVRSPRPQSIIETLSTGGEDIQVAARDGDYFYLYLWTDPFSSDRFREERRELLSAYQYAANNEPAARFVFDVYIRDSTLIYVKEPCGLDDPTAKFFLHVTPTNLEDLPDDRRQYGFDNLDFEFFFHGMAIDGKCVGVRDLPEYDIAHISTGQFIEEEGHVWEGRIRLGESGALLSAYQYAVNNEPAAQSVFDLYVGEGSIIYLKEPCAADDVDTRFFLHVTPTDEEDLSDARKEHGFDNLDFEFSLYGMVTDGRCIAVRDLPEYDILRISTGQFDEEEGEIWRSDLRLGESVSSEEE